MGISTQVGLRVDGEASREDSDRELVILELFSCTPLTLRQLKGGDDVIRYLRPLCLCIPTPTLSHYQYIKPVLSISALFNSPRSSKPRQLSLPSRLSHLLSPNLDDGAGEEGLQGGQEDVQ